jgi:energy-coupling factor transporter ATP-binding protein EcfA2
MRISHVSIQGFRSLKNVNLDVVEDYTTLIGKNDCGKSSFLRALEYLFDPEIRIGPTDVCGFREEGTDCFVEATLSDCWYEAANDGQLKLRRTYGELGSDSFHFEGPVPRLQILKDMSQGVCTRTRLDADTTLSDATKDYAQKTIRELCPKDRVPPTDWVTLFNRIVDTGGVEFENGWHVLDPLELQRLVQVVFLSADVRGEEETSTGGASLFDKIGRFVLGEVEENFPDLVDAKEKLTNELEKLSVKVEGKWQFDKLNSFETALREEIGRFDTNVAAEANISAPRLPSLDFSLGILVSDEWTGSIGQMGHGMRRSLVFAMLRAHRRLLEAEHLNHAEDAKRPLFLFLIEEPEIYLHPQAERRRMAQLKVLSADAGAQVILCTHSATFVDLGDYKGIQRLERPNRRETTIRGWQGTDLLVPDRKTLSLVHRFDPGKAAMLFADLVILVEGQCESDGIPVLAELLMLTDADREVEVVDCAGNQNIPTFQKVLEAFGVRYVAWPDSDVVDVVASVHAIRTGDFGKIVLTDDNWETMNGFAAGGNNKSYNSWKYFVFDGNAPNLALETRIRAAYGWNDYPP